MLDVKAVDKEFSEFLINNDGSMVLKNLDYLLRVNKLYEVRTIIFPNRDKENKENVTYVAKHISDKCFYKIIRYRQFGVRENNLDILGDYTTDEEYADKYLLLAKNLGAIKAYIV